MFSAHVDDTHGTVSTGNEMQDRYQATGNVVVEWAADKMAEKFAEGCFPTFAKPSLTPDIYRAIMELLQEHRVEADRNPNVDLSIAQKRLTYLVQLDEFASWLWQVCRKYMPTEIKLADDSLAGRMQRRGSPMSRYGKDQPNQTMIKVPELPATHLRQTDEMVQRDFGRRSGWT